MAKSRAENILTAMINQTPYAEYPQSRLEDLLLQLKEVYESGSGSTPTAADVSYDNTTSGMTADDVQDAIDEVFQSVSSGKTLIAGAITDKGVTTSASDTFATMATNIAAIPTGGDVEVAFNVYDRQTAYVDVNQTYTVVNAGTLRMVLEIGNSQSYCHVYKNNTEFTPTLKFSNNTDRNTCIVANNLSVAAGDVIKINVSGTSVSEYYYLLGLITPTS